MRQSNHVSSTRIEIGRKGSLGIEGTFRNAEHHAKPVIPLVKAMIALLPDVGFKKWVQFNNIHTLVTEDDREFNIRPLVYELNEGRTWGLRVSMKFSRKSEITLFDIKTMDDVARAIQFFYATNAIKENLYVNRAKSVQ